MPTAVEIEKQAHEDKKVQMIEDIRQHLSFMSTNIGKVPEEQMAKEQKDEIREYMSKLRFFLTHDCFEGGEGDPQTPVSYVWNMICKKNGGVAQLCGAIAGPRLAGWTRIERQQKEMLKACFVRACNYVPPPDYHPEWLLPWDDPRNTHPGAVEKRRLQCLQVEQDKKDAHAEYMAKQRKIERLEKESKERLKTTEKQRKDRAKHFKEQEEERQHGDQT